MKQKKSPLANEEIKEFLLYIQMERGLSKNSILNYGYDLKKLMLYFPEYAKNEKLKELPSEELREAIREISPELSSTSLARLYSTLRAFYGYWVFKERIVSNPVSGFRDPKAPKKLPTVLSIDEIDGMIASVDMSKRFFFRNICIIELLYSCGLRVSELCDLTLSDIYREEQLLRVHGKGNKERLVPYHDGVKEALEVYFEKERSQINTDASKDKAFVFLNNRGGRISRVMIFLIIKEAATNAGIQKNISPHTFRHSFATHMLSNGADLRVVQDLLGHENLSTTEIYTHISDAQLRREFLEHHPRKAKF